MKWLIGITVFVICVGLADAGLFRKHRRRVEVVSYSVGCAGTAVQATGCTGATAAAPATVAVPVAVPAATGCTGTFAAPAASCSGVRIRQRQVFRVRAGC